MLAGVVAASDASGTRIKLIGGVGELQNRRRPLVPCRGETFLHGACFFASREVPLTCRAAHNNRPA